MNKLLLCFTLVLMSATVSAQKVYFIYLQSESEQPFFIRMNEKVHSSSSTGYLILSKLADSTYNFTLGFPQNKWPEQKFSVTLNRKDHGYLVKNFGEKGWGLFNLQTLAVQMSSAPAAKVEEPVKEENKNVSAFTDILSKASDDPSLKEKKVAPPVEEKKTVATTTPEIKSEPKVEAKKDAVKTEEVKEQPASRPEETTPPSTKKEETKTEIKELPAVKQPEVVIKPEEKKDTVVVKPVENTITQDAKSDATEAVAVKEEQPNSVVEEYKRSTVSKRSESSTTEGFGLTFIDDYENGTRDTIKILIPNPKPVVAPVKEQPKEEKKFLDIQATPTSEAVKEEPKAAAPTAVVTTETVVKPVANTNCNEVAAEADFFKLRKTMAAAEGDDDMIAEAKKQFKIKCFSVIQIKNLSTMFLNDEGKYRFFDASYNHTSDKEVFSTLQSELKDEYYINRFKAMLRN